MSGPSMPYSGGGGRFRPEVVEAPVAPTGAHIGGIPGSPMLIDPARENQPDTNLPFNLPGDFSGKKFISNDAGEVVDYVAPPIAEPRLTGGQDSGYYRFDSKTGKFNLEIPPAEKVVPEKTFNVPVSQSKSGAAITVPMTAPQLESKWHQLSEFGQTNDVSRIIRNLGRDRAGASQSEVIRVTKDGKRAVYDASTKQFLRYAD